MWEEGVNASKPVKLFAEEGDPKYLDSESKQGYGDVLDTFTAPPISKGVGSTSVMVTLDGKHTQLSFIMKIVPSPDWFVGLSSENLCADGKWRNQVYADLRPMDAGTDQGLTFTAPNWPHEPHQPISEITNVEPDHPASSFYYPEYQELPRLAYVELELLSQFRHRRTFSVIDEENEELNEVEPNMNIDFESSSETVTPNYMADSSKEKIVTPGTDDTKQMISNVGEVTTAQFRNLHGRGYSTGNEYSTSTSGAEQITHGKAFSVGHGFAPGDLSTKQDVAAESTASTVGIIRRTLRMPMRTYSGNGHGPIGFAEDGEPRSDVSSRSFDEPQFEEVAKDLALPSAVSAVTHCEVTEWTEWTPCSQTCGFGKRERSRDVLSMPSKGGANCPPLRQESLCGSMRNCKWNHFSFLKRGGSKRRRLRGHHKLRSLRRF
ncbi:spondin-2 [Elysia marginata]|uniref:Spondin-2 n=1 Tax=Elysia marginata TaxID=1093978 RepID=A0AAV4J1P3_9GAST|nr:spondin-2 [Elysia marginata]